MFFLFRLLLISLSYLLAQNISAAEYYWTVAAPANNAAWTQDANGVHFSKPADACAAAFKSPAGYSPVETFVNSASGYCRTVWTQYGYVYTATLTRSGDSCPANSVYDPVTGECKGDPCLSTVDQIKPHRHNYGVINGAVNDPPTVVCDEATACQFSNTWEKQCYRNFNEDKESGYCDFKYKGNGISCTTGNPAPGSVFDQPPTKPPLDRDPTLEKESECTEFVAQPDGTGKRTCTSVDTYNDPGVLNCDGASGVMVCTPGTPAPNYSDTKVTEETTKTTNPDGSTKTDSTKVTDKTTCKGAKPCTSTTATEGNSSGTNPDGTPGDSSSSCTGTGCKPSDTDEGKEEEDEEEEPRTASTGACDGPFQCSGDAIDCAVLKAEKDQYCHAKEQADYEKKKTDIEGLFQGEQFTLEESEIIAPSFINSAGRFLPSGCPAPETASMQSNGGHTLSFKYEPLCRVASDFSWFIVAFASLWAAVYVGRAFGGE